MRKLLFVLIGVIVVLAIGTAGIASAASPSHPLYTLRHGLELGIQNLRLAMAGEGPNSVGMKVNIIEDRVAELNNLVSLGKVELVGAALDDLTTAQTAVDLSVSQPSDEQPTATARTPDDWQEGEWYIPPYESGYCDGTITEPSPVGQKLAEHFNVTYEEIMSWYCKGNGFGEIALAYAIAEDSGKTVEELFAMHEGGMGWGEILISLGYLPGRGHWPKITVTPGEPGSEPGTCPTETDKKVAAEMANSLGVPVEDILNWRCQNFGYGEIAMAYGISKAANVPVEDVFAMRAAGKGWGEILQFYGLKGHPAKPDLPKLKETLQPGKYQKPARPTLPDRP